LSGRSTLAAGFAATLAGTAFAGAAFGAGFAAGFADFAGADFAFIAGFFGAGFAAFAGRFFAEGADFALGRADCLLREVAITASDFLRVVRACGALNPCGGSLR